MLRSLRTLSGAVVLVIATSAIAQPPPGAPSPPAMLVDPTQLAAWLASNDATVAAADQRLDAAAAARAQTGVIPNPELSLAYGGFVIGSGNKGNGQVDTIANTTNLTAGVTELVE